MRTWTASTYTAAWPSRAAQRDRIEELVRYCARPPLAHDRLEKRADGRYLLRLKTRFRDGTTHLLFESVELMERLTSAAVWEVEDA